MHRTIKAKLISVLVSFSLLTGGITVMAADTPEATAIGLGDSQHITLSSNQDQKWFSFTPEDSGWYLLHSANGGSAKGFLFDADMTYLMSGGGNWSDDGSDYYGFALNWYGEAGNTYYIEVLTGADGDDYDIVMQHGVEISCTDAESFYPVYHETAMFVRPSGGYQLSVIPFADGTDYQYEWYSCFLGDGEFEKTAENVNTLSCDGQAGSLYCCIGLETGWLRIGFDVCREVGIRFTDPSETEYMLADQGEDLTLSAEYSLEEGTTVSSYEIYGSIFSRNSDRLRDIDSLLVPADDGAIVSGGVSGYSLFLYGVVEESFDTGAWIGPGKNIGVFVMGDSTDGVLTSGEPVHIAMNNDPYDGSSDEDYSYQRIYEFTPEEDGAAVISVSDIVSGVPCVALFDSGYRRIGQADSRALVNEDEFALHNNFIFMVGYDRYPVEYGPVTLTASLNAGETYYIAVPVFCQLGDESFDQFNSEYDLTLTFTADEEPAADTPAPENPSDSPAPEDPADAPVRTYELADFVERLYTIALGRPSDPVGKADWVAAVTERGQTGADVARGFLYSPEFLNKDLSNEELLTVLYRTFFDREPDAAGFSDWLALLEDGHDKQEIIEGFINSVEWERLCALYGIESGIGAASDPEDTPAPSEDTPTPTPEPDTPTPTEAASRYSVADFVERLYTVALGRASDPVGKADWIEAVTERGQTGADLARGFLFSPEFLNKDVSNEEFVRILYRTFFDREADTEGLNGWVNALDNGQSKQEVIEGFINSTEWANLCLFYGIVNGGTGVPSITVEPNQQTIDFCTRLYTTCLGREADQDGLMAWARQLANQRDTGTGAAHGFFFSDEFVNQNISDEEFVTRLYRTFMNREPDEVGFNAWLAHLTDGGTREAVFNGFSRSTEFGRICADYGIIR